MQTARRRGTTWAVAASIVAHLGVLTALLLQRPTLRIPLEAGGPPEAIIPLLILPRTPPPATGQGTKPAPIQLHRRPQRNLADEPPVVPLLVPAEKPADIPAQAPAPAAPRAPPQLEPPSDAVRATLRSTLGCTEARMAGFTREDRSNCLERFGRGARDEPYLPPALSPATRAALERAGAAKLAQKTAAERAAPTARLRPEPADYDGEPYTGPSPLGPVGHAASKRAAPTLGRLPP